MTWQAVVTGKHMNNGELVVEVLFTDGKVETVNVNGVDKYLGQPDAHQAPETYRARDVFPGWLEGLVDQRIKQLMRMDDVAAGVAVGVPVPAPADDATAPELLAYQQAFAAYKQAEAYHQDKFIDDAALAVLADAAKAAGAKAGLF